MSPFFYDGALNGDTYVTIETDRETDVSRSVRQTFHGPRYPEGSLWQPCHRSWIRHRVASQKS